MYKVTPILVFFIALAQCAIPSTQAADCDNTSIDRVPLVDMGTELYLDQFAGGLYPNGANVPSGAHLLEGKTRASRIQPLDSDGHPHANGRIAVLSIGLSNTAQEFWAFAGELMDDDRVRDEQVTLVNGAFGGADATVWESPESTAYDTVRDTAFRPGLTEAQVQAVWLKVANRSPDFSLPSPDADAYRLTEQLGNIVRALKVRYPNLKMVFLSSRIYAGYSNTGLSPEPYAYENGFSVKWLIEAQIRQMQGKGTDGLAGDLDYNTVAPWLAWGPYMWADGVNPREWDGLTWRCGDFQEDGTHPSVSGKVKVALQLQEFFLVSPFTVPWFRKTIPIRGDCTGDGRFDHDDVAHYADCISGPGAFAELGCLCADFDGDSFLDLHDFAIYQITVPFFD